MASLKMIAKTALMNSLIGWKAVINNNADSHRVIFTRILDAVLFIHMSLAKVLRSNSKAANAELYLIHLQKNIHSILNDTFMTLRMQLIGIFPNLRMVLD